MTRDQLPNVAPFHLQYINELPDISLEAALHLNIEALTERLEEVLTAIGDDVYEPGKWNVATILQHLIDTERIMTYRALRFARLDKTPLSGFEENDYAEQTLESRDAIPALLEELKVMHISTLLMFNGFNDDVLLRTGIANETEVSVAAIGFMIAGHQQHHLRIIEERYVPLAKGRILPI